MSGQTNLVYSFSVSVMSLTSLVHSQIGNFQPFYQPGEVLCKFFSSGTKYCQQDCTPLSGRKNTNPLYPDIAFPIQVSDKFGATHDAGVIGWIKCNDVPNKSKWTKPQGKSHRSNRENMLGAVVLNWTLPKRYC